MNIDYYLCVKRLYPNASDDDFGVALVDGVVSLCHWNVAILGPEPTLDQVAEVWPNVLADLKREEIKEARNVTEASGFKYLDKVFDSDADAMKRISIAVQAALACMFASIPYAATWTLQDNSTIDLTGEQVIQMPLYMAVYGNMLHTRARELKDDITRIEESYNERIISFSEAVERMAAIVWSMPA